MKLSVITVCYNIKDEIEKTCKSIVEQSFQDFEWIVIDGGSTDGTLDILNKYTSRINILISEKDGGIYNAMNKGILRASGEYINFMNGGDSFYNQNSLVHIKKYLNTDIDLVYGNVNCTYKDNKSKVQKYSPNLNKNWFLNYGLGHQATFIKRICFEKYGLYDETFKTLADWEKWITFFENNISYKYINKPLVNQDMSGISSHFDEKWAIEKDAVLSKHFSPKELSSCVNSISKNKILRIKIQGDNTKYYLFDVFQILKTKNICQGKIYYLFGFLPIYKIHDKNL